MTKRQHLKLVMYMAVIKTLRRQVEDGAAGPAVLAELERLEAQVADLRATEQQRETELPGVTDARRQLRRQLELQVNKVAKATSAWARVNGDPELRARVQCRYSMLPAYRAARLADLVETVVRAAKPLGEALQPYGVDPATVARLEVLLRDYLDRLPATRTAISRRRRGTQILREQVKSADAILKALDELMEITRGTAQFLDYRNVRKLAGANRAAGSKAPVVASAVTA